MVAESTGVHTRRNFFNQAAKNWNDSLSPEEAAFFRSITDKANTLPDLGKRVLDIGCGAGVLFPFLIGWDVTALDVSEEMLERARQRHAQHVVEYVQGDAQKLPFPVEHFAKVMMLAVYPHFDDPLKVMQEIFRVLKPGGVVALIHLKDAATVNHIHASIGGVIANDRLPDADELQTILHKAGFEICHSEFKGQVAVICRKPH
jgi:ubiquinone/menaquinone biosynthesis C-methylase UbiE